LGGVADKEAYTVHTINIASQRQYFVVRCLNSYIGNVFGLRSKGLFSLYPQVSDVGETLVLAPATVRVLSTKGRYSLQYFAGIHRYIALFRHTHFFHQHLTLPFSPCQTNAIDCDYTVRASVCVVLNFRTVTSLVTVLKLNFICELYVRYHSKVRGKTFITGEYTTLEGVDL
jgi:hypothetical protein